MLLKDIKSLHVELSSKCNAWCPSCARNKNGYGLKDNLVPQNLDVEKLKAAVDALPNLHDIQFCGRYGDPAIHPELNEILVNTLASVSFKFASLRAFLRTFTKSPLGRI